MNTTQLAHVNEFLAELEKEQTRLTNCLVQGEWIATQAPRDLSALDLSDQDRARLEAIRSARLEIDAEESVDPDLIAFMDALAGIPKKSTETNAATGQQRPKFECVGCNMKPSPSALVGLATFALGFALFVTDFYLVGQRLREMNALRAKSAAKVETGQAPAATAPQ